MTDSPFGEQSPISSTNPVIDMYALVDCNSFFCSVEKVFHPGLEGKPVCVLSNNDGCIVAGFPIPLDNDEKAQDIELLKMLCPNPESCYLIRVEGYSMIDAGIHSGDIVIVDKSNRNPTESQVAVCEFNGDYTLKRFVKRDGFGWLIPANPDFPEIKVTPDDRFSIWGTVTYIIHKPRH